MKTYPLFFCLRSVMRVRDVLTRDESAVSGEILTSAVLFTVAPRAWVPHGKINVHPSQNVETRGRPAAERETLGKPRVIEDVAQRAADDQILFHLPRIWPWRRPAPFLDIGAGNHASISTGALRINFQCGASVAASSSALSAAIRFTDGSSSFMDLAARMKGRNAVA